MTTLTDIHICTVRNPCDNRATYWALFRGSLSPVCDREAEMVVKHYDATLYDERGREVSL